MSDDVEGVRLPDGFVLYFPAWIVVDAEVLRTGDLRDGLTVADDETRGYYLPLFSDEPLAGDFLRAEGGSGKKAAPIGDKAAVWAVLEVCRQLGVVSHVGIDVTSGTPPRGRFYTLAELRAVFPRPA